MAGPVWENKHKETFGTGRKNLLKKKKGYAIRQLSFTEYKRKERNFGDGGHPNDCCWRSGKSPIKSERAQIPSLGHPGTTTAAVDH